MIHKLYCKIKLFLTIEKLFLKNKVQFRNEKKKCILKERKKVKEKFVKMFSLNKNI